MNFWYRPTSGKNPNEKGRNLRVFASVKGTRESAAIIIYNDFSSIKLSTNTDNMPDIIS